MLDYCCSKGILQDTLSNFEFLIYLFFQLVQVAEEA